MKPKLVLFIILLISASAYGQVNKSLNSNEQKPALPLQEKYSAKYKSGIIDFYKFIGKRLKYPKEAKKEGLSGTVKVKFIVGTDGYIKKESVEVVETTNNIFNEAAITVISSSPRWTPATNPGTLEPVEQMFVFPVLFRTEKKD